MSITEAIERNSSREVITLSVTPGGDRLWRLTRSEKDWPSLESAVRDIYGPEVHITRFEAQFVQRMEQAGVSDSALVQIVVWDKTYGWRLDVAP